MKKRILVLFTAACTIGLLILPGLAASDGFADMAPTKWYAPYIQVVTEEGLMSGVSDTRFAPDGQVTRAQAVQTLYAMAGKPDVTADGQFSDLTAKWYQDAVNWAAVKGITAGYPDGTFKPNKNVTREELATILYKYETTVKEEMEHTSGVLAKYPDADQVHSYAIIPMEWAVKNDIIGGTTKGLEPGGTATRAQLATILCGYIGEKPAPVSEDIGEARMYLINESGSTETLDAITIYAAEDLLLTQIELDAWDFDGSRLSYIYVDDALQEKEQLGDTQMTFTLTGDLLKPGTHTVRVFQFDNNDPSGKTITRKTAKYTIVRK